MTYNQIIVQIQSGLAGNYENDIKYLISQHEVYKNHDDYKRISRTIRTFMYNIIPNDEKLKLKKNINENNFIEKTLSKVEIQIQGNDFNKALEIIEPLIKEIEKIRKEFSDDSIHKFYNFDVFFEEQIYMELFNPIKKIRQMPWGCTSAYLKYGVILVELKKFDEAKKALKKANKLNPVNTSILFELSEIYKINKDWGRYLVVTIDCLKYAYSSDMLARCYRNYGFFFIGKGRGYYKVAIASFCFSMIFSSDKGNEIALAELQYIEHLTRENIEITEMLEKQLDKIVRQLKNSNIQIGANKLILNLALILLKNFIENNQNVLAKDCYEILSDLTRYKKVYDLIEDKEINALIKIIDQ
jgi:tetratricopeptide (TPR) repeat protein